MSKEVYFRTSIYLVLIIVGWLVGEYPHIPSFSVLGYDHVQPNIEALDKCMSVFSLLFSTALLLALWDRFWVRICMIFITWGMIGNVVDEFLGNALLFSSGEQIVLFCALFSTGILIFSRWTHKHLTKT